MGNSTKTLLASGNSSETSVLGICRREVCPSPSLNDVDGDEMEETNMDGNDTPSQFDQNDQKEEEEEFEDDEEFTFGKPALKKIKTPLSLIKMIREKRRRILRKVRIFSIGKPAQNLIQASWRNSMEQIY